MSKVKFALSLDGAMPSPLSAAVVGVGTVGQVHARVVAEHPGTDLTTVVDLDEETARSVGDRYGAGGVYTDTGRALAAEPIDLVVVATPETAHLEPTERALDMGCDVLLEKPIAASVRDAERIGELVETADADLAMGFTLRSDPRYAGLGRRVADGDFGTVLGIQAARIANRYIYRRAAEWAEPMTYLASHDVDAMRWFVDAPVTEVTARASPPLDGGDQPAVVCATLQFANGTVGSLETNWARSDSHPAHRTDEVRLTGTEGHARLVLDAEETGVAVSLDSTSEDVEHEQGRPVVPAHSYLPTAELHGKRVDTYRWQLDRFVDVVRGDARPLATWVDGLRALVVANALTESYESGRTVQVPEPDARGGGTPDE